MQTESFRLIEAEMDFVSKSTLTKSFIHRLPGSRTRLLSNNQISIYEEYLKTGNLESYSYAIEVSTATHICFEILSPQTHLLYHLDGRKPIQYQQPHIQATFSFRPFHGAFFYAPKTVISLHFEPGKYHIQGFTLPLDLLDLNGLSGFDYLDEVVGAHRQQQPQYRVSLDFEAMEHTRRILGELSTELLKKPLIPKLCILKKIQELLYLIKDKMLRAKGLLRHPDLIVQLARELIGSRIAETDGPVLIIHIAESLFVESQYLNYLHKERYGVPITHYSNQELLKKAKHCLGQKLSIKITTSRCGFSDQSSFCHFFKRHTGQTPSAYIRSL
ncbi:MAG: hypothetical protein K0R59_1923 [Sphingobacterium sp.]|jgi:AraC-like DNA-binding protein|nr:hypothetical protein [Sphingobacterium sp.]